MEESKANVAKGCCYIQIVLLTGVSGLIKSSKSGRASCPRTRSRAYGPSPAIFPKAHTACSATIGDADLSSLTNFGTAPCLTFCVCTDVPEATLVNTHATSNCKGMLNRNEEITSYSYRYMGGGGIT